MKTSRIKSIVIVILALANIFLLVLLLGRSSQQRIAYAHSVEQLSLLLANNGIAFDTALLPGSVSLPAAELSHDADAEATFVRALLGDDVSTRSGSSGSLVYESEVGYLQFRTSSAIDGSLAYPVEAPADFLSSTLSGFGYRVDASAALNDTGSGTAVAVREVDGRRVFNAPLTFTFKNSTLTSVSGSFLPSVTTAVPMDGADAITALVRFLDYRNSNGLVCTEITSLTYGYLLQSTAANARLVPAWHIATDISEYYVNSATGEITRE